METRIKERLTGALILVALMVIVVPEFLSGHDPRASADAVPAARPASEGPPLVTYHMPLDGPADAAAGQAALNVQPTQSSDRLPAPTSAPVTAPAPAPAKAETPPASAPAPAAPVASPAQPEPQTAATPKDAPAPARVPDKKAEVKKPAEKPADKPAEKKAVDNKPAEKKPADKKGWFVQLGVFAKHENAEQMVKQAGKKGHSAQITGSGSTWRVRVGPLSDRAAAQALKKKLAAEGLPGTIVAP